MNIQRMFEQSENKAVFVFVTIAILAHFALMMLFDIV